MFVWSPTREVFTYMETSPLPVKGCKFWPMLVTYSHWAVRVFSVPHLLWYGMMIISEDLWHSHLRRAFGRGAVTTCRGLDLNSQHSACGANAQTHCTTVAANLFKILYCNVKGFLKQCWKSGKSLNQRDKDFNCTNTLSIYRCMCISRRAFFETCLLILFQELEAYIQFGGKLVVPS